MKKQITKKQIKENFEKFVATLAEGDIKVAEHIVEMEEYQKMEKIILTPTQMKTMKVGYINKLFQTIQKEANKLIDEKVEKQIADNPEAPKKIAGDLPTTVAEAEALEAKEKAEKAKDKAPAKDAKKPEKKAEKKAKEPAKKAGPKPGSKQQRKIADLKVDDMTNRELLRVVRAKFPEVTWHKAEVEVLEGKAVFELEGFKAEFDAETVYDAKRIGFIEFIKAKVA